MKILLLISAVLGSCTFFSGNDKRCKELSSQFSNKYYPTRIYTIGDTLNVKVYLPKSDIISATKTQMIRQLILVNLMQEKSIPDYNVLSFNTIQQEDTTIDEPYLMSKDFAIKLASETPSDTTWNKWTNYIMKNIDGYSILHYNKFINFATQDANIEDKLDSSSRDLIYCLSMYIQQCRGAKFDVNYAGLLHLTDTLCAQASRDGVVWNHDYDSKKLKYFFDNCCSLK